MLLPVFTGLSGCTQEPLEAENCTCSLVDTLQKRRLEVSCSDLERYPKARYYRLCP